LKDFSPQATQKKTCASRILFQSFLSFEIKKFLVIPVIRLEQSRRRRQIIYKIYRFLPRSGKETENAGCEKYLKG